MFEELKQNLDFGEKDERLLRSLHARIQPELLRIAGLFYRRVLERAQLRAVVAPGQQSSHLAEALAAWIETLLCGPWDRTYYERRARIGRIHLHIALPQNDMFTTMNMVRRELDHLLDRTLADPAERSATREALHKLLDLELTIMLHTYREDVLVQQARGERLSILGQLVGSIGHELRNPLSVIETSLFLLKDEEGLSEHARKHLERIGEQVRLTGGIVANMLDMIRDRPPVLGPVRLRDVLAQCLSSLGRPPEVRLVLQGLEELPPVSGEAGQLRQVFFNLLENAVHATAPRGEIRVVGTLEASEVEVAVEDTGAGVDPALRDRLFEPLVSGKPQGTGLGLALVKHVLERHGGAITHEPRKEGGTRFVVRLRVAPEAFP